MKTKVMAVCMVLALGADRAAAQWASLPELPPDVGAAVQVDFPGVGNYDLYDYGLTAKLEFRDWITDVVGYGLSIGFGDWSTKSNATRPGANLFDYSGSLQVVPIGAMVRFGLPWDDFWSVNLNLELTYMMVDSDISARNRDVGGTRRFQVDIDDNVQLTPSIDVDYRISDDLIWSFGVGYRYDLDRGSVETELGPARDNIMESFYLQTALRFAF